MTKTFDELWRDIEERSQRWAIPIVQDRTELEHVFNLIDGCDSYLEIGTAEGNGLYVLAHSLKKSAFKAVVDFGELHTTAPREEVLKNLGQKGIHVPAVYYGNSHSAKMTSSQTGPFEVVFIDAGHTYEDVIADAAAYGHLATKYIFFHDIQIPDVKRAFDWYCAQNPQFKRSEFINSTNYGYGILEV